MVGEAASATEGGWKGEVSEKVGLSLNILIVLNTELETKASVAHGYLIKSFFQDP